MKILVVSDTESSMLTVEYFRQNLSDIDFIISCGDLKSSYLEYLSSVSNLPIYYVHGNHDEHYIKTPPQGCESIDDKLVVIKGLSILGIGGCRRYREGDFQYSDLQMWLRYYKHRLSLYFKKIDILVTHAPAYQLGDQPDKHVHRGFKVFNHILDKHQPRFHLHGHNHLNYGRQKRTIDYKGIRIVNAYKHTIIEI